MGDFESPDWVNVARHGNGQDYMLHIESQKFTGEFQLTDGAGDDFELNVVGDEAGMTLGPFSPEELYALGIECQANGGYSKDED